MRMKLLRVKSPWPLGTYAAIDAAFDASRCAIIASAFFRYWLGSASTTADAALLAAAANVTARLMVDESAAGGAASVRGRDLTCVRSCTRRR